MIKGGRISRRTVDRDDLPRCTTRFSSSTACYLTPILPITLEDEIEWSKHQVLYPGSFATRSME